MMLRKMSLALAAGATLCTASVALADPPVCFWTDTSSGTAVVKPTPKPVIYLSGSTALGPALQKLAAAADAGGYSLVASGTAGSCGGIAGLSSGNIIAKDAAFLYFAPDGSAGKTCNPKSADGTTPMDAPVDVVLSDVSPALCDVKTGSTTLPNGFTDQTGPINGMIFAVPGKSQQQAISAEEAYLIFGMGADGGVDPWTDPDTTTYFAIRSNSSGTRAMINANIGDIDHGGANRAGTKKAWVGNPQSSTGTVIGQLVGNNTTLANANKSIGIMGVNDYINNRTMVKPLAFRAFKQSVAYWPGSNPDSLDMRNIRDGRYKIWGAVHMITPTTASAGATFFINLLNGSDSIDGVIAAYLTPVCAMHVTHDIEGGDQKPYSAAKPCDCYFEAKATGKAPAACKTCSSNADCGTGRCDLHGAVGYCEAK